MATSWTGVRHFIVLSLLSAPALASSVSAPLTCEEVFQMRHGALVVSPQQRAIVEFQKNEKYLAHGSRGAEAFLQMALYKTNDDIREIGREIVAQNMSPHKVGTELSVEQRGNTLGSRLSAIQELAVAARQPNPWYSKVTGSSRSAVTANKLAVAIGQFFDNDMKDLEKFEEYRLSAVAELDQEASSTQHLLNRVREEKHYVKSLIDRMNEARHSHALATDIDVHIDLELTEKMRVLTEYEITFEQTLLSLQLRHANLLKAKTEVEQIDARLAITAAHVPEFMTRLRAHQSMMEQRSVAKQKADATALRRAQIYEKNGPRREIVAELKVKRDERMKKFNAMWDQVKSGDIAFVEYGYQKMVKKVKVLDTYRPNSTATVGGTLHAFRTPIAKLSLSTISDGLQRHPIGTYLVSKQDKTAGRIVAYSKEGLAVLETAFDYRLVSPLDYTAPSELSAKTLRALDDISERIGDEWSKPDLRGQTVYVLQPDSKIVTMRVTAIEGSVIGIATPNGPESVDAKRVALASVASRPEMPFKLDEAVTNGKRLARVVGYFKNGIALVKTLPSERGGEGKFEQWLPDEILAAKIPKPDHPIGSTVEATQWIYECEVRTTYKIVEFDPESNSYQVDVVLDYVSGNLDGGGRSYFGHEGPDLTRGGKGRHWLKAEELTKILPKVYSDRRFENRMSRPY